MPTEHESSPGAPEPTLGDKLRFLRSRVAHAGSREPPACIETHMSWVFLAGDRVLKLKKPVRFPFLDFSTLQAREFYCREELRLNARLAPGVYLGLLALQAEHGVLRLVPETQLPAPGRTVDWLVLMRRLPEAHMLPCRIAQGPLGPHDIDALVEVLAAFYRRAPKADVTPAQVLARFQRERAADREVLLRPQFRLRGAAPALERFDAALSRRAGLLRDRALQGRVVEGHGDLRPQHICMLEPPVVIDCIEFNAQLRQVDPFDEIAFLALECDMEGAAWIGPRLVGGCAAALGEIPAPALMRLYTAHRALLRARLAMAHLLDPQPRTPDAWPPRAERYLERALDALDALDAPDTAAALTPGATHRGTP